VHFTFELRLHLLHIRKDDPNLPNSQSQVVQLGSQRILVDCGEYDDTEYITDSLDEDNQPRAYADVHGLDRKLRPDQETFHDGTLPITKDDQPHDCFCAACSRSPARDQDAA
jgi:hypothetical protein